MNEVTEYLATTSPIYPLSLHRTAWSILKYARPISSLERRLNGLPLRVSTECLPPFPTLS
jgi:hypothetical protein